ncbi:MAG: peptidylprolyl isomerase [Planctomycetaceae bacterium]|nr:peptidylprolyl isomerase [Planctomycetaceae bacterium]
MSHLWRPLCLLSLLLVLTASSVFAASEAEDWTKLSAQKTELIANLKELQAAYQTAETKADKDQIAKEFEAARTEYQTKVFPRLAELAPKIFAADPKNTEAGEAALESAFQANRYDAAVKLATALASAGDKSMIVQNMGGISLFATHEFEKAHEWLAAAEKEGVLHPQLGQRYLDVSEEYVQLWEKEQAVRAKEAQAKGDALLPRVQFDTTKGKIVMELYENEAPNTVANFVSLIESKSYDGTKFHRVIPTFMAQGGDPLSKDDNPQDDGTGGPGYVIKCECYQPNARMHFRGSLSMAHTGKDTGGSQFFITHLPTAHLNPDASLPRGHTVFGRVVEGLDIAASLQIGDRIETATVLRKRNHAYKPETQPDNRRR